MGELILFGILAIIAIVAAVMMLVSRNAVHSALYLVLNFFTIAVFYLLLNAPFLAMVQITVYAGAIMVLFLFVIMLLGAERAPGILSRDNPQVIFAGVLALILAVVGVIALTGGQSGAPAAGMEGIADSSPTALALVLFENYVFPFEVTGIVLLVAVIGLYVMSKKLKKGA